MPFDFKKEFKDLYLSDGPAIVEVPGMKFVMIDGKGAPGSTQYQGAVEALYALSYAIKMGKFAKPEGFFGYVVPPLEGLWRLDGAADGDVLHNKDKLDWVAMIRQPDFVTEELFELVRDGLKGKKPRLDLSKAKLISFREGLCAQVLHVGPYDDEPATIARLMDFIASQGYKVQISGLRRHHEIYLSDPRKTDPDKLKTVIRYPVERGWV